jgi:hypothetical protein
MKSDEGARLSSIDRDALVDEQQFLLVSLGDLEREFAAGDIDETDYATLKSGYTARAAAITRILREEVQAKEAARPRWTKRAIGATLVLVVGGLSGWLVASQSGQRLPGQSASGGIDASTASMLSQARATNFTNPVRAIQLYSAVLKLEPDNVEALTYRSWLLALSASGASDSVRAEALATAVADLTTATTIDSTYADAWCFLGIVNFRFLDNAEAAKGPLDTCQASNPPHEVAGFVSAIVDQVTAQLGTNK